MRSKLGFLLMVLMVLLALAGLLWSLGLGFPRAAQPVDAFRVRRGDLEVTLAVSGVVEAQAVDLAFPMPGRIRRVVAEGTEVVAGQLLAELDAGELVADVAQARQAWQTTQEEVARAQAQVQATLQELRRSQVAVEVARAQVEQARAALAASRARLDELLATPREEEVRQAQAAVEAARAAWEQARQALEVQERLYREGATSRVQLDLARSQVEAAHAQYRQAQAQLDRVRRGPTREATSAAQEQVRQAAGAYRAALAQVQQAQISVAAAQAAVVQARALERAAAARSAQALAALQAAQARLARATLRAPFRGEVTRVYLRGGATVTPGVPVVSLAAAGRWATAEVEEADVGKMRVGQHARVRADAYPGLVVPAQVTRIAGQVETRVGTRMVRVRLDFQGQVPFRVGTGVDVDVVLQTVPQALLVPVEAVASAPDGASQVYVIEGSVVRVRQVRTVERNEDYVAIREGLREGDLVALAEPGRLRDGQRVQVRSVR